MEFLQNMKSNLITPSNARDTHIHSYVFDFNNANIQTLLIFFDALRK